MWTTKPLLKVASKRYYANVLYVFNVIHIIVGLACLGLALSQFAPVSLGSTFVDFRLLNVAHVVTGSAGLHMLRRHFGSVVVGALYCLSFALSLWTCAFYSYSCAEEVSTYRSMLDIKAMKGGDELITDDAVGHQYGKITVCVVMVVISAVEFIVSAASAASLNKLASDSYANLRNAYRTSRTRQMAFVSIMKAFFSVATMILGAYLESSYKLKGHFVKIGWQELAGCVGFVSAMADLRALYGRSHNLLYLKISLVVGVASAVFSIKTLDYAMVNHFVIDLRDYSHFDSTLSDASRLSDSAGFSEKDRQQVFVRFVVHASVIACLVLIFAHSVITSVECASYVEWSQQSTNTNEHHLKVDRGFRASRNRLGFLQIVCGSGLVALTIISLVTWNFSKGYEGGSGVLWLGCLFVAAGCVTASQAKTFATSVYVMACISCILSLEYSLYSINFIYQAVRNAKFQDEIKEPINDGKHSTHVGRIILYSIQAGLLFLEFFTSTYTAYTFGYAIKCLPGEQSSAKTSHSQTSLCVLGALHLLYAMVTIAISIAAEVVIWKYSIPVQPVVFVTNGVVVFICVAIQCSALRRRQFLIASAILNVVCASIAFFVVAPYTAYLYNQVAAYRTADEMRQFDDSTQEGRQQRIMYEWVIGLTALILCLSIMEFVVASISGMICSYILHNINQPHTSDLRFSTMRSQAPTLPHYYGSAPSKVIGIPPHQNGSSVAYRRNGNGHVQERYFGSNYRTYAEQIVYNPEMMFNGREQLYSVNGKMHRHEGGATKVNGQTQTNIRHVFNNPPSRYMAPY